MNVQNEWVGYYKDNHALWFHDGNVKRPHALLTSGKHSSGFFNSEPVMENSLLLDWACSDLVGFIRDIYSDEPIHRVIGPAMGAITLADGLARWIEKKMPKEKKWEKPSDACFRAYTEKEKRILVVREGKEILVNEEGLVSGDHFLSFEKPKMVFKRTKLHSGERVLLCEDVITTGGSVSQTTQAVAQAGGIVVPFVAVLVNRSDLSEVDGKKIIALVHQPMPIWNPDDCPLCKQGSEAIRPKGKENWARLNAEY